MAARVRFRRVIVFGAFAVWALALIGGDAGCTASATHGRHPVDRGLFAGPQEYGTDWVADGIYRTTVLTFLVEQQNADDRARYVLVPSDISHSIHGGVPRTLEEYHHKGPGHWPRVRGALPAGTRFQYKGMQVTGYIWWERWATPLGLVLEREWPNAGLVSLVELSESQPGPPANWPVTNRKTWLVDRVDVTSPVQFRPNAAWPTPLLRD